MKRYFVVLLFTLITLLNVGCEKEVVKLIDDVTPPVITDPVVFVTDSSAVVSWITDEPCSVGVSYWRPGEAPGWKSDPEYRQNHAVNINGLKDSTTYYYYTVSYDMWGNFTVSDTFHFTTRLNLCGILLNAWEQFEAGNYQVALEQFKEYIKSGGDSLDAYCGLGWSKFFIDCSDTVVYQSFVTVLGMQPDNTDALAGLSYYAYCDSDYVGCVDFGEELLSIDSNYVFVHNTSIDYCDINVIVARGLFELELYRDAVNFLSRVIDVYISEDVPDSWIVDGVKFDSYEEALDKLIENAEKSYLYLPGL